MLQRLYLVAGYRTPFCKFGTHLSDEPLAHLGISPTKHLLATTGLDVRDIDEVVFGCCYQTPNTLGNVARTIAVRSGIPEDVPAVTVHRNCASGFEAISYVCDKAAAKRGDVFIAGGVENMSQAPFLFSYNAVKKFGKLSKSKTITQKVKSIATFRPTDFKPECSLKLGMVDSLCDMSMGQTAELLAREYGISRLEQDRFSESSHLKAATNADKLQEEIAPFALTNNDCIRSPRGKTISTDNGPRSDSFVDKLAKLRPVFDKHGTVTAGNSSQVTDGGCVLLLMTDEGLRKTGCTPIAQIIDYAYSGCDPKRMGLGPVDAIARVNHQTGLKTLDADLFEINEAFAAQTLAVLEYAKKILYEIPTTQLNVNGGAVALGHPLAATGTRLVLTLAHELRRRNLNKGLASLCIGGGQGGAIWIENV